jgi:hypothetical protein
MNIFKKFYLKNISKIDEMVDFTFSSEFTREADKINYAIGLALTFSTTFILGASPGKYFFYWVSVMILGLFTRRSILFRHLGYHFYLIDYCYYCNFIMLIFIFFFPESRQMYIATFSLSSICLVMLLVRNIIVFHDLDKMAGSVLHMFPCLIMWNIHWNIRDTPERKQWGFCDVSDFNFSYDLVLEYFYLHLYYYIPWAIFYYTTLNICWDHILSKNYYCFMIDQLHRGKYVKECRIKFGSASAKVLFASMHYVYTSMFNLLLLPGLFSNVYFTGTILFYFYLLIKRGGEYYVNVFSKRYEESLKVLDKDGKKYDPLKLRPDENIQVD